MIEDGWLDTLSLDGLPLRQRQILFLRYYLGYTQQESARILGMDQAAVSREENRARSSLKRQVPVQRIRAPARRAFVTPGRRDDPSVIEYRKSIAVIERRIRAAKARRAAGHRVRLHPLYVARGSLRKVVAYLTSHERLVSVASESSIL